MSILMRGTIEGINKNFSAVGIKREYSFTDTASGLNLYVTSGGERTIIGESYGNSADAIADLNGDAFAAMSEWAAAFKKSADDPLPTLAMYETIRDLTEVAVDGVEARKADETCFADRLNYEAGQYAVARGQAFVDHYSDAYRGGDLK